MEPAPERDAVRLVDDPVRVERVQVPKHRFPHQPRVQGRDAVDLVRAQKGEVPHADAPSLAFVDERNGFDLITVQAPGSAEPVQMQPIDQIDDLHMARQHALHEPNRPSFQRLGQERMVRVVEGVGGDAPRLIPVQPVLVHEQAHQLGDGDGGMRVVELERGVLRQRGQARMLQEMAVDEVLQGCRGEEEFLAQRNSWPAGVTSLG